MRGREEILEMLTAIDNRLFYLGREVAAYMIGGGNMALRGLKGATKDIDLVIPAEKSRSSFLEALSTPPIPGFPIAFKLVETIFGETPVWIVEFPDGGRLDIFGERIGPLKFSKNMAIRAEDLDHLTGEKFRAFEIKLISIEDLIITKLVTSLERERDVDDLRLLLPFANPNTVLEEMKWQLKNGWFDEVSFNTLKRKLTKIGGSAPPEIIKKVLPILDEL